SVAENVVLGAESTLSGRETLSPDETRAAGWARLVWGVFWRLLTPAFAVGIGALVTMVLLLLAFNIATYLPQDPALQSRQFQRLPLTEKAELALGELYAQNAGLTTVMVWGPLVVGALAGAAALVLGVRHARKTWRGKALYPAGKLRAGTLDSVIDSVVDLVGTVGASLNRQRAIKRVGELSRRFNLEVDASAIVEKLPVGLQQRVEIVKALYRKANILILDEPTAVLTPQESQELFRIMRDLAAQGVSIIFITHKLKEVFAVADSIVVMRNGAVVGQTSPREATLESLAAMMVGREFKLSVEKAPAQPQGTVLDVRDLSAIDDRGSMIVDGVSFTVRAGEVLGVAGVQGNGQTELVEVLTGLRKAASGAFSVNGVACEGYDPRAITLTSTAHVPEDRHRFGMVKPFSVAHNLILNQYFQSPFSTFPSLRQLPLALLLYLGLFVIMAVAIFAVIWLPFYTQLEASLGLKDLKPLENPAPFLFALLLSLGASILGVFVIHGLVSLLMRAMRENLMSLQPVKPGEGGLTVNDVEVRRNAQRLVKEFDIRTPSVTVNAGNLSGGNQQKMVIAREFNRRPRLLIAAQPTRGIDVGAELYIHERIVELRDQGAAVLLVSAELDEIMDLSDRIAVMYKGRIIDIVPGLPPDPSEEAVLDMRQRLGQLMAGIQANDSAPAEPHPVADVQTAS
ncbi:MAG: ATP-binding cassette domain-containing protein, partial [Anaerolineae bacterium]|nr:ATP-binding cassette domain-containing protein [Anaerolineae bacterium]